MSGVADDPGWFAPGSVLIPMSRAGSTAPTVTVRRTDPHNHGLIVYFAEVDDRDRAATLKGFMLTADRGLRRSLDADEYWPDELEGRAAVDAAGESLGVVTDVVVGAAQDRLVVTTPAGFEVEVPFVAAIVTDVLPDRVVIDAPEGLFD